ncbi:MAG TPA: L,D-transpeptidase [Gaiellaceae bacterium]|nr:L,D-transpeptidase [Gaiellaceae bacterium]
MRASFPALLATVVIAAGVAAAGPSGVLASSGGGRVCAAGQIRWLETWDRSHAGRLLAPATIYRRPGAVPFLRLQTTDRYGFSTTVPIVAERLDRHCRPTWFRVRVSHYPNGTLGWIRAGTMATSRIRARIVIDVSRHRLFLYKRGRLVLSTPAAVGKASTPTPRGRFYITQRFIVTTSNGPYGARALGISAFSDVLRSWRDGGPVGIHGTNEPFSIGRPVSHGCVRLPERAMLQLFGQVPLATPVVIRD